MKTMPQQLIESCDDEDDFPDRTGRVKHVQLYCSQ
jgi:hypothetical protein